MAELRDIDSLVLGWQCTGNIEYDKGFEDGIEYVLNEIDKIPTVDAKPVVHANWISRNVLITPYTEDDYEEEIYSCSNCTLTIECETPYCPYCGAQMDEKEG